MPKPKRAPQPAPAVAWLAAPQPHDFPAAAAYLALIAPGEQVSALIEALHAALTTRHKAKDLLRASRLPLLDKQNVHVGSDLAKIAAGQPLSPVLLVRGDLLSGTPLHIADGYHRVCASYHTDENTDIPCRLVPARSPSA